MKKKISFHTSPQTLQLSLKGRKFCLLIRYLSLSLGFAKGKPSKLNSSPSSDFLSSGEKSIN